MKTLWKPLLFSFILSCCLITDGPAQDVNFDTIKKNSRIKIEGIIEGNTRGDAEISSGKYVIKAGKRKRLVYLVDKLEKPGKELLGDPDSRGIDGLKGHKVTLEGLVTDLDFYTYSEVAIVKLDFISWDQEFEKKIIAARESRNKELLQAKEDILKNKIKVEEDKQRAKAKAEFQAAQMNLRVEEDNQRAQAETNFQAAQDKMRLEEEKKDLREQRITDLKSGKLKITNIEDATLAFNPSNDDKYTIGLPIDGLTTTGQYYMWGGTLSWHSGKTYYCLDGGDGSTKCFGFTNVIVRFNEMRENSQVTVVGKLTGTSEVTLTNKLSGVKENKKVAVLTDCYVF